MTRDMSDIRRDLDWSPKMSVDEGLVRSIRYYEQHLTRYLD